MQALNAVPSRRVKSTFPSDPISLPLLFLQSHQQHHNQKIQQSCLLQLIAVNAVLNLLPQDDHRNEMPFQAAHQILLPPNFKMKQHRRRAG